MENLTIQKSFSVENALPRGKEPLWRKKEIAVALGRTEAEGLEGTEHSQMQSAGFAVCEARGGACSGQASALGLELPSALLRLPCVHQNAVAMAIA